MTVRKRTAHQEEGRGKFFFKAARNHIHQTSRVKDGVKPKLLWHLFFGEVCFGHVDHHLPVAFNETIGRLMTSGGSNDVGITCWGGKMGLDCFDE